MTFDEWFGDIKAFRDTREFARKAWDAAQAVEREACAVVVEDEIGWYPVCDDDPDRPTQVSHVNIFKTREAIAAAIRARGNAGEGEG